MHFCFAKIKVAASVCTGGRNCPPDSSIVMGSNPIPKKNIGMANAIPIFLVRMTGFEPAASCSQSKRSTKLSHIRLYKHIQNIYKASALPVAVPSIFVVDRATSSSADRGHSLDSLYLPLAALVLLPKLSHIRILSVLYMKPTEKATKKTYHLSAFFAETVNTHSVDYFTKNVIISILFDKIYQNNRG